MGGKKELEESKVRERGDIKRDDLKVL